MTFREFIPKEHGAWAMWIVPMLSAALLTRFALSFFILFVSFGLLYTVHHPIVMVLRKKSPAKTDARWAFAAILPSLILAGVLIFGYGLMWLILFGAIECAIFLFNIRAFLDREQRSFINELTVVASLTLCAPAAYYAITGFVNAEALVLYSMNFLFFASSIFYVKTRIEFLKTRGTWRDGAKKSLLNLILYHVALLAILLVPASLGLFNPMVLLGFVPMLIQFVGGTLSRNTKMNFKRLGVGLVVQSAVFLIALSIFLRK